MDIKTSKVGNALIVEISGALDGKTSPQAQEKVIPLIEPNSTLILDLTNCNYISSSGLRFLLMIAKQIPEKKSQLFLTGLTEEVKDVMDMTGFSNFFKVFASIQEARASLEQS